jgi:hypothetical protein
MMMMMELDIRLPLRFQMQPDLEFFKISPISHQSIITYMINYRSRSLSQVMIHKFRNKVTDMKGKQTLLIYSSQSRCVHMITALTKANSTLETMTSHLCSVLV